MTIEAHTPHTTTNATAIDAMKVTPLVEAEVTAPASTKSYVHTNVWFLGGPNYYFVFTRYADHVTFRLWQRDAYI